MNERLDAPIRKSMNGRATLNKEGVFFILGFFAPTRRAQ